MARFALTAVLLACVASTAYTASLSNVSISRSSFGGVYAPGDLIFQEEFDSLNLGVWHHEVNMDGGGNNEFQIYDKKPENAYVRDGVLYVKPTLTLDINGGNYEYLYNGYVKLDGCTGNVCERKANYPNILQPAYSARLRTMGSFSFHYGRVEVRAQMPSGDWTWPAVWMLPENWVYGGWPLSGEIDIVESRGNRNLRSPSGQQIGSELAGSTLHFGPAWNQNGYWAAHGEKNTPSGQGFDRDFHTYEVEWTDSYIKFRIDGQEIKSVNPPAGGFYELGQFPGDVPSPWNNAPNKRMAPFDQNFHLIINNAVGGGYFPRDSTPAPVWGGNPFLDFMNNINSWQGTWQGENHALKVDYIRVYAV